MTTVKKITKPAAAPSPSANLPATSSTHSGSELAILPGAEAFEDLGGVGLENVKTSDILIPRITILQSLSPQVKDNKPEFIEGAKEGMICDVGTGQLIGEECLFVPVHYLKVWIEWYPRKSGKGLAEIHSDPTILDQTTLNDKKQPILPNGNYISETAQLFGLDVTDGNVRHVYIPFSSTQLKKCKRLLTLALSERIMTSKGEITPPLFYRSYVMSVVHENNSEGDWYGWKIERGPTTPELPNFGRIMEAAAVMRSQIDEGKLRADIAGEQEETNSNTIEGERM